MFLKCKQDFAKEREKKINAATESKKKKKKKGYRAWTKEEREIQWFIQQRFVPAPCRMLHSSILKRRVGWGWKCSALSASRWEYWLPEPLGGPSSSKGSGHSQGGVPPLRQIAHSDWSKEGLQPIGPRPWVGTALKVTLPLFLRPGFPCSPAFRWRPQGAFPTDTWATNPFQVFPGHLPWDRCSAGTVIEEILRSCLLISLLAEWKEGP